MEKSFSTDDNALSPKEKGVLAILQKTGALLNGHFLLTSGVHSDGYIQCARILQYPSYAREVMELIAQKVKDLDMETIVGPALGGIIAAYELGRQLNKRTMFAERKNGVMQLRRGFVIKPGEKVLITEDVVTAGTSTGEVKKLVEERGAVVIGVACIVDRRSPGYSLTIPIYSALKMSINTYFPEECPLCKIGKPLENPGSRFI